MPPRNQSPEPSTAANACVRRPAVHDSAQASVRPSSREATRSAAVSRSLVLRIRGPLPCCGRPGMASPVRGRVNPPALSDEAVACDGKRGTIGADMHLTGTGVWSGQLRYGDAGLISEAAAELDELGYSAIWIPDVGGDVLGSV